MGTDNGLNGLGLDCWGPVLNMNRDPRWGRNAEGGTEDPYLMGQLAVAWTLGLQKGDGRETRFVNVAVTLKHFDANSLEGVSESNVEEGVNRHTVSPNISKYLLADYYWPAFRAAVKQADAKGFMCSYNAITVDGNSVPTCADPLMKAARRAWGFTGYVTSDSDAVGDIYTAHHYAKTAAEASCLAIKNGQCDIDSGNTFYNGLLEGVKAGNCSMDDVDGAVFNSLRIRFELGLFDPIADQPLWELGEKDIGTASSTALNLKAAQSSLVLLQNPSQILPLERGLNIAVIGPYANTSAALIQHDSGLICPGKPWNHNDNDPTMFDCVQSPFQAISVANRGGSTVYERGCGLVSNSTDGFAAAREAGLAADVVILGLGIYERPLQTDSVYDLSFRETEGHDRSSIDLPEIQKQLAKVMIGLGKPVIIVLLNGGMVAVGDFVQLDNVAIIEAFYPGKEGALALATSIFGSSNRFGKMPFTIYPASWTASNPMLDHDVTHKRTYRYGADAVFPFGHGLSLTSFKLLTDSAQSKKLTLATVGSNLSFTIIVQNTGKLTGDEVVMAYFSPVDVDIDVHPIKSLFDFIRVHDLADGASESVKFTVTPQALALATEEGDLMVLPGGYMLYFENGAGEAVSVPLTVTGKPALVEKFPNPQTA